MKPIPLVLLAMATAIGSAPTALANSVIYDWSVLSTASNAIRYINGTGTLTVNSGTNAITGITGTITDTIDGLTEPVNGLQSEPGDTFTLISIRPGGLGLGKVYPLRQEADNLRSLSELSY
ncbi:MAG: hypothetical protein WAK26_12895 [Terracidiphilus sp.]